MVAKNAFNIKSVSDQFDQEIWNKINLKTKPVGALGKLEDIAFKIARIQQTLEPKFEKPTIALFAGDHGIAKSGLVNPYPQEVTYQMVMNFLQGGAAINVFAKEENIEVQVIDAGVNYDFPHNPSLLHAKMAHGTADYRFEKAMPEETALKTIHAGAEVVANIAENGANIIGFGEMGIGNTSSAALIMSAICNLPVAECVGRGTGADDELLRIKIHTLKKVVEFHQIGVDNSAIEVLASYGGFEIAQMCGGMLQAAALGMVILVDGFISTAAMLVASKINPSVKDYAIYTHQSEETGHMNLLKHLEAVPLLNLGMRLGEGTGCVTAYPLLKMGVAFFNNMASFESAAVSTKNK